MTYWIDQISVKPSNWQHWIKSYPGVECRWQTKVYRTKGGYRVAYDGKIYDTWEAAVEHAVFLCDNVITQKWYPHDNWQDAKKRIEATLDATLF